MNKNFIVGLVSGALTLSSISVVNAATLVGYWAFEEGAGSAIVDSSGNNINGSIVGSGVTRVTGFDGQSLSFDGSNSQVLIPHQPRSTTWIPPIAGLGILGRRKKPA